LLTVLQRRAALLAEVRRFFALNGVLEVETPLLSRAANTDPAIQSMICGYHGPPYADSQTLYLHTSPEFAMKRLLAAGSGAIYQVCKVFRDGERGSNHNPEFSLLEWYRPAFSLMQLMQELAQLLGKISRQLIDKNIATQFITYRDLFLQTLAIDPLLASNAELADKAAQQGIDIHCDSSLQRDDWLNLLMTHVLEPAMEKDCMTFVYHYPASQASLAQITDDDPPVAERFECFVGGMELANGFHELRDSEQQRQRFEADNQRRKQLQHAIMPLDENFLSALQDGLPDCSGVAVGLDRLLMWLYDAKNIDEILAFPWEVA